MSQEGHRYTLRSEPTGTAYYQLVDWAMSNCKLAMFVVRPDLGLNQHALNVISELHPFLVERETVSKWPGTELLEGQANILYFDAVESVAKVIQRVATGLYSWIQPDLPEDLSFLTTKAKPLLVSITHEHDAYVDLSVFQFRQLAHIAPEFSNLLLVDEGWNPADDQI
jgi:hypothetical protein